MRHLKSCLSLVLTVCAPCAGFAQAAEDPAAAATFLDLSLRLPAKSFVVVTDQQGREQRGRLISIDHGALTIQGSRRVTFAEPDVKLVRQKMPDRILEGGLIGFAIGTLAPLAVCTTRSDSSETVGCAIGSVGFGGLPGFAIGAFIDRARGRMVTWFRAPGQGGRPTNP